MADTVEPLTDETRVNAFVVDDSLFERTSCKKTELGSRVFDHTSMKYRKGYRLMTLGWTDGNTFLPINSSLLASSKERNLIGPVNNYDGRSLAAKRRKLAQMKGTDVMIELLKTAQTAGHRADYVLFDTWFSSPAQLLSVKELGLDSIAMIKKSPRIYYEYEGKQLSINKIFGICKKRRGRSKYLLSVNVMVGKDQKIPAKIVCVRNKKNKKDWVAFICTNPDLSEEEIIGAIKDSIENAYRKNYGASNVRVEVDMNEGNVSVKAGTLEDDHADLSDETFALAPGEEATFTYTYEVTQDDIDAGEIVNVVKANATAERGDDPEEVEATATVTTEDAEAKLSITKAANPTEDVAVGATITYTVVVKNEGNVSVKDGKLEDDHADLSDKTFALAPGEEAIFE